VNRCNFDTEWKAMLAIRFDDEAAWNGDYLLFWAWRGTAHIRCQARRRAINELPGFKEASSQTIGAKKREIVELLKPYVLPQIQKNNFSRALDIRTDDLH
jgi:hypothetical protein